MSTPFALIGDIGGPELVVILFIVLLLFGANRLPELARGLGKSVREFKKATSGVENEIRRAMEEEPPAPQKKPIASVPQSSTPPAAPSVMPTTPANTIASASNTPADPSTN